MTFRVEIVCLHNGGEQRCSVVEIERAESALETLGMSEPKARRFCTGFRTIWPPNN